MKKQAMLVMLFATLMMVLFPILTVSAEKKPLPGFGFYEDITGSGTLVVAAEGGGGHPDVPGTVWWRLIITGPNGQTLYSQELGSYVVLNNLPYGTYRITFQANMWTGNTYYSAHFQ
ncbi:hypothetical protein [Paenibacillus assamensis]|uniref:hypothetical protein n=1 Tax=Paenibacillus assamensis TaxID=311244 RepID=UPI00048C735A|nr:hypothetical protein [Paenibacillus assamensis]